MSRCGGINLEEAEETLDRAKHTLMEGDEAGAFREAIKAARKALVVLASITSPHVSKGSSLAELYGLVSDSLGRLWGNEAWRRIIDTCVKLLDKAEASGFRAPNEVSEVEDVIACAEEILNWVEALTRRRPGVRIPAGPPTDNISSAISSTGYLGR